jgi:hypothetical protein
MIGRQSFTLIKIAADRAGTFFYFEETFDPDDYIIALYDHKLNLYLRNRAAYPYYPGSRAPLVFDALDPETVFFTLFIQNALTNESVEFKYHFEQAPVFSTPVYMNDAIPLLEGDLSLTLENATFGSGMTDIAYSMRWTGNGTMQFGGDGSLPVRIQENTKMLTSYAKKPFETIFGDRNALIGRIGFAPVVSRDDKVTVTFSDIFLNYRLNRKDVNLERLFDRGGGGQSFYVGRNRLILEGMAQQSLYVVLVMHSEDPDGERVETVVETALTIETDDGPIVIPGECLHNEEGTDVLFDLIDIWDDVKGIPITKYTVELISVMYSVPPQSVTIDIPAAKSQPDVRSTSAKTAVNNAFMSRLAYKSLETGINGVKGFSNAILNDRGVMRFYTPSGMIGKPAYAAKVVHGALLDRNTFACVAEEEWIDGIGGEIVYYRQTHKVVAEYSSGSWTVTSDELCG